LGILFASDDGCDAEEVARKVFDERGEKNEATDELELKASEESLFSSTENLAWVLLLYHTTLCSIRAARLLNLM